MIAWWAWVLLWIGLAVVLVSVLGTAGWQLFRKALRILEDAAALTSLGETRREDVPERVSPSRAILTPPAAIREREQARRVGRATDRRRRHEQRMLRGRKILAVDAARTSWPPDWYR